MPSRIVSVFKIRPGGVYDVPPAEHSGPILFVGHVTDVVERTAKTSKGPVWFYDPDTGTAEVLSTGRSSGPFTIERG